MHRCCHHQQCSTLSFASKFKLCKSLVTSILLYSCETWTLLTVKKGSRRLKPSAWGNFFTSPTCSIWSVTGYGARSTTLWAHRKLFWQLSRGRNLHGSGVSHAAKAFPNPSFRASWRVDDAMVGRGNAGWISSKSDPCPCQNCWQGPLAEKTGTGSLLNGPSCSPDDSVGQGTALNWTWCMLEARGKVLTKGFVSALGNSFAQNKVLWVLQAAGTVVLFIRIVQTASYPM